MTVSSALAPASFASAAHARPRRREGRRRLLFVLLALGHALICRFIQDQVLAQSGVFEYMGLHWLPANLAQELVFLVLAVAPALLFIPVRLTRGSDLLLIIIYGTVFVPTTALFPNVVSGGVTPALWLTLVSFAGLWLAAALARLEPGGMGWRLAMADNRYDLLLFGAAAAVIASYLAFVPIQVIELDLTRVYEFRAAFGDQMSKLSPILLYVFVNSALALSPIMIVRGILRRNWAMVLLAFGLTYYTFAVTSYRSMLFVALFVAALTVLSRTRISVAISIFGFFVAVAVAVVGLDALSHADVPANTFAIHYRLFGNSATITSAYLDIFSSHPKFYYSQSFMRLFIRPPTEIPYPLLVGHEISTVQNVWANGNMVADAFANLGYAGVLLTLAALGVFLCAYNHLTLAKDRVVAALTLVAPGFYLSNGGLQSAVLSGGLGVTVLLMLVYPDSPAPMLRVGADREPAPGV
ncbi:MAG: hypothetical protein JSR86_02285 [Proteobacteria bacterium]|nr:hypothetical protein [Pseudomonadota bacterium]